MFLKKIDGKRAVRLPDGRVLTRADLPPPDTVRWVASRKAAVVRGVAHGLLTEKQAMERYGLSAEEFMSWVEAVASHGEQALKTTKLRVYRKSDRQP